MQRRKGYTTIKKVKRKPRFSRVIVSPEKPFYKNLEWYASHFVAPFVVSIAVLCVQNIFFTEVRINENIVIGICYLLDQLFSKQ
jgi:hypothetical protein